MQLDLNRISKLAGLEDKPVRELKRLVLEKKVKAQPSEGRKYLLKQDFIDALTGGEEEEPGDEEKVAETKAFFGDLDKSLRAVAKKGTAKLLYHANKPPKEIPALLVGDDLAVHKDPFYGGWAVIHGRSGMTLLREFGSRKEAARFAYLTMKSGLLDFSGDEPRVEDSQSRVKLMAIKRAIEKGITGYQVYKGGQGDLRDVVEGDAKTDFNKEKVEQATKIRAEEDKRRALKRDLRGGFRPDEYKKDLLLAKRPSIVLPHEEDQLRIRLEYLTRQYTKLYGERGEAWPLEALDGTNLLEKKIVAIGELIAERGKPGTSAMRLDLNRISKLAAKGGLEDKPVRELKQLALKKEIKVRPSEGRKHLIKKDYVDALTGGREEAPAEEPSEEKAETPEEEFHTDVKGLERLHGQPPFKTNASMNRDVAMKAFDVAEKANISIDKVVSALVEEFPEVFHKTKDGLLGQKYDSFYEIVDDKGRFALKETKYTITSNAANALIRKIKTSAPRGKASKRAASKAWFGWLDKKIKDEVRRGTVDLTFEHGKRTVPALLLGDDLAVHKEIDDEGWNVTHVHSGFVLGKEYKTKKKASHFAYLLKNSGLLDLSKKTPDQLMETIPVGGKAKIRAINRGAKEGHRLVDMGDWGELDLQNVVDGNTTTSKEPSAAKVKAEKITPEETSKERSQRETGEERFQRDIKGLERLDGQPPTNTNAKLNFNKAGDVSIQAFKVGLSEEEIISELVNAFPKVFYAQPSGLAQKYDSYYTIKGWHKGPLALEETKHTITQEAVNALIKRIKNKAKAKKGGESEDPGQAVTENPKPVEKRDPQEKTKALKPEQRKKAVRQKWAKNGITDPKEQQEWKEALKDFPDHRYLAEIAGKLKNFPNRSGGISASSIKRHDKDQKQLLKTLKDLRIRLRPRAVDPTDIPPAKYDPPGTADANPFKPWFKGENPAVDILIKHGDKFLTIRRGRDVNADGSVTNGALAWPGGFIDPDTESTGVKGDAENPPAHPISGGKGEDPMDAAWRELAEETGLKKEDFEAAKVSLRPLGTFGQDRKWDMRISPTDPSNSWVTSRPFVIQLPEDFELPIEAVLNKGYDDASWKGWVKEEDLEKQVMFAGHHGLLAKAKEARLATPRLDRIVTLAVDNQKSADARSYHENVHGFSKNRTSSAHGDALPGHDGVNDAHGRFEVVAGSRNTSVGGGSVPVLHGSVYPGDSVNHGSDRVNVGSDAFSADGQLLNEDKDEIEAFPGGQDDRPDETAPLNEGPCKPGPGCYNTWPVFSTDRLPGGLADDRPDEDFDPIEVAKGMKVEMEHVSDPELAREITKDHLVEHADYYKVLSRAEAEMGKGASVDLFAIAARASDKKTGLWGMTVVELREKIKVIRAKGQEVDTGAGLKADLIDGIKSWVQQLRKKPPPVSPASKAIGGIKPQIKPDGSLDQQDLGQKLVDRGKQLLGEDGKDKLSSALEQAKGDPEATAEVMKSHESLGLAALVVGEAAAKGALESTVNLISNVAVKYGFAIETAPVRTIAATVFGAIAFGFLASPIGLPLLAAGPLGAVGGIMVSSIAGALGYAMANTIKDEMGPERMNVLDWFRSKKQRVEERRRPTTSVDRTVDRMNLQKIFRVAVQPEILIEAKQYIGARMRYMALAQKAGKLDQFERAVEKKVQRAVAHRQKASPEELFEQAYKDLI